MIRTPLRRLFELARRNRALATLTNQYASLCQLRDRRLALLGVANVLDTMSVSIIVPLLPAYAERLGANPALVGLIFAAPTVTSAVLSVPFGHLSDRTDRRRWIWVGMVLGALSVMAVGLVESALALVALRAVDGAASAMRGPATTAYIGDAIPETERASAMGAYQTTGMVSLAIGPALGGGLAVLTNLAVPFVVLGAGTFVGAVVLALYLPPIDRGETDTEAGGRASISTRLRALSNRKIPTPVLALGLSAFVASLGTGAFGPLLAPLFETKFGLGPGYTGVVWSVFGLSMLLFVPIGGTLADRTGRKRNLLLGKALWGVVVFGLAVATVPALPPILLFMAGIASAFAGPALGTLRYETAPDDHRGAFLGLYSTLGSAGMALGPLLGWAMAGALGVEAAFVGMGVLWLADAAVIVFWVREPEPANPGETDDESIEQPAEHTVNEPTESTQ